MRKKNSIIVFSFLIFFTLSCSSGYRALKKGDYYKASIESIEMLRTNPTNQKAQFVFVKSYPLAIKAAQREINIAQAGNELIKYDILVDQLEKVNHLANMIYRCPKANEIVAQPIEFIGELATAKENAAEQAYKMGNIAMNVGTLEQARFAFQYFTKANNYIYGYKNVLGRLEEARYNATLRVLVEKPITSRLYQFTADFFTENLLYEILRNNKSQFIRFYTYEEAGNLNMNDPHQFLVVDFVDFTIENYRDTRNTTNLKRDSVLTVVKDSEGKTEKKYITVTAKLTSYQREIVTRGVLSVRIFDAQSKRIIQQRNFGNQYVWRTSWGSFNGDERALTNEQKAFCERQPEYPPSQQQLFYEFTQPVFSQAVSFLKSVYKNY
ncbi:MAG: hypothetical protein Q7U47_14300 [Paludibacter sp.]|nr:hypothetical protein [Paludibacter sp.]